MTTQDRSFAQGRTDRNADELNHETGGKHFSRDAQPTDKDGNPVSLWRVRRA